MQRTSIAAVAMMSRFYSISPCSGHTMRSAFSPRRATASSLALAVYFRHRPSIWSRPTRADQARPFFGTLKRAVACICAIHIADRLRCMTCGEPNSEILEAGLILVILISIASVGPAAWSNSIGVMREHALQLLFAGLAVALCIVERSYLRSDTAAETVSATARRTTWFSIWR
jgi:hypothetical protein